MTELENELKVTALMERIGQITSEYEGKMADLRVQSTILITALQQELEAAKAEVERLTRQQEVAKMESELARLDKDNDDVSQEQARIEG